MPLEICDASDVASAIERRRISASIIVALAIVTQSCGREEPVPRGAFTQVTFEDILSVEDTLALEETDAVIYVNPAMSLSRDQAAPYLIADRAEHQIRRLSKDGRLVWSVGRRGAGPGEYDDPRIAIELPDSSIFVAETMGRFTILDGSSLDVRYTVRTPFRHLEAAALIRDSLLLVTAQTGEGFSHPRLHIWDVRQERIVTSFFSPFDHTPVRDAAIIGGFSMFAVRADTVAAVWSLADSLFIYSIDGRRLEAVPLMSSFRPPRLQPPSRRASEKEHAEWLASFDYLSGVWWIGQDHILLQYFELLPEEGLSRRHHLLLYSRADGTFREVRNAPRVMYVDSMGEWVLMLDPQTEVPNRWLLARPRFWRR